MTLILDLPMDAYQGDAAVSHGKLRDFEQLGPKGYWLRHVRGEAPRPDTKALRNGRAFETYLLDAPRFQEWFAVKPEGHKGTTNEGKRWVAEQEAAGRTIIDRDDFVNFEHMKRAIDDCGAAKSLLEGCAYQPTWRTAWPGIPGVQARPDLANTSGCPMSDYRGYSVDLKTTRALDDLTTGRSIVKYGYHSQAATVRIASEGEIDVHYLLAVEKAFPCRAVVIEISRVFVDIGERWAATTLERLATHYEADFWPLVEHDTLVVEPPPWLLNQHLATVEDDDAPAYADESAP